MKIKAGFADKTTEIKVFGRADLRNAEFWINQTALEGLEKSADRYAETLSYITLDELLDLKDEINTAIQEITGGRNINT